MNIFKRILTIGFMLLFAFNLLSTPALAAEEEGAGNTAPSGKKVTTNIREGMEDGTANYSNPEIGDFITATIDFVIVLGALLCLMYMVWGGVDWVTSGGDQQKYAAARNKITAAIFGLMILTCVYAVWLLIVNFLGLETLFDTTGS